MLNTGLGQEGDGIDGNGYILVDGYEIISAASPFMDSGLDSNFWILIDGDTVYAVGCSMDMAEKESKQSTLNLLFNSPILSNNIITKKMMQEKKLFHIKQIKLILLKVLPEENIQKLLSHIQALKEEINIRFLWMEYN